MKLFCKNISEIPSIKKIHSLTKKEFLVLEFSIDIQEEIENTVTPNLKTKLTNYSVFLTYREETISISIIPVITEEQIIVHLKEIKKALTDYIALSNLLLENVTDEINWNNWELTYEHFPHNRYEHLKTGQIAETCAYKMTAIEQIDIYFFGVFIQTSKSYPRLNKVLVKPFHDTARILDYLKANNEIHPFFK